VRSGVVLKKLGPALEGASTQTQESVAEAHAAGHFPGRRVIENLYRAAEEILPQFREHRIADQRDGAADQEQRQEDGPGVTSLNDIAATPSNPLRP